MAKFFHNLPELAALFRSLLAKDGVWYLQQQQIAAINTSKEVLTKTSVPSFYNLSSPTRVSADASSYGLGAPLEQKDTNEIWKRIGFASRSPTSAECNYAQIEKETWQ